MVGSNMVVLWWGGCGLCDVRLVEECGGTVVGEGVVLIRCGLWKDAVILSWGRV